MIDLFLICPQHQSILIILFRVYQEFVSTGTAINMSSIFFSLRAAPLRSDNGYICQIDAIPLLLYLRRFFAGSSTVS